MIKLDQALTAWGTPEFPDVLKRELVQSGAAWLPLQQGLSIGNYVADEPVTVVINKVMEMDGVIRVTAGIFFRSVIGGCSCTDDPTPASDIDEYCELQFDINRMTAATTVSLLKDDREGGPIFHQD